jgi:hypothetical protein
MRELAGRVVLVLVVVLVLESRRVECLSIGVLEYGALSESESAAAPLAMLNRKFIGKGLCHSRSSVEKPDLFEAHFDGNDGHDINGTGL